MQYNHEVASYTTMPWPVPAMIPIPQYAWRPQPIPWVYAQPPTYTVFYDATNTNALLPTASPRNPCGPPGKVVTGSNGTQGVPGGINAEDIAHAIQVADYAMSRGTDISAAKSALIHMPSAPDGKRQPRIAIQKAVLKDYTPPKRDAKFLERKMVKQWAKDRDRAHPLPPPNLVQSRARFERKVQRAQNAPAMPACARHC